MEDYPSKIVEDFSIFQDMAVQDPVGRACLSSREAEDPAESIPNENVPISRESAHPLDMATHVPKYRFPP